MLIVPNLEGLLPTPLLPPEELEKEHHGHEEKYKWLAQELCLHLSVSKEEGVWIGKKRI